MACGTITIGQPSGEVVIGQPICGAIPRDEFDDLRDILKVIIARDSGFVQNIDELVVLQMESQAVLGVQCGTNYYAICTPKRADWYGYVALDGTAGTDEFSLNGTIQIYPDFITSDELLADNGYTLVYATADEMNDIATEVNELSGETLPYQTLTGTTSGYTLYDYVRSNGNVFLVTQKLDTIMQTFEADIEPDSYTDACAFGGADEQSIFINEFGDITYWLEAPTTPVFQMQLFDTRTQIKCAGYSDRFEAYRDGELQFTRPALHLSFYMRLFESPKGTYKGRIYSVRFYDSASNGNSFYDEWLPCTNANGDAGFICMQRDATFLWTNGLTAGDV